ncbi:hypothetical protein [Nocardia sp. NPDC005745]|uniref:hypothetical protein n=1 Tax=Nocardia sp. NPDC005745 TaxID=3157061 RepID=UPI0033DF0C76
MTMSYEPPSGAEDLAAQAEQVARERDQLEQEMALVRQRRAERPSVAYQPLSTIGDVAGDMASTVGPVDVVKAGAVIDPDGMEYELDGDGDVLRDGEDKPIPKGDYERDENGVALLDDAGRPFERWPHDTIEYKGRKIQIKKASPEALQAMSLSTSDTLPAETQLRIYHRYVDSHISMRSRVELMDAMLAGEFTMDDYRELFKLIAKAGSGRPTKPSRA